MGLPIRLPMRRCTPSEFIALDCSSVAHHKVRLRYYKELLATIRPRYYLRHYKCYYQTTYDNHGQDRRGLVLCQSYISKGMRRQGIDSFVRISYVSTLCPVVICPYLCTSDARSLKRSVQRTTVMARIDRVVICGSGTSQSSKHDGCVWLVPVAA